MSSSLSRCAPSRRAFLFRSCSPGCCVSRRRPLLFRWWPRALVRRVLPGLVPLMLLAACGGGDGAQTPGAGAPQLPPPASPPPASPPPAPPPPGPPPATALFRRDANPRTIVPALDATRAVSQRIPVAGGTLVATGADGTRYTLVIPDRALLHDTTITMTPVVAADGLPFERLAGGVDLAPDGLELHAAARLTIEPASSVASTQQVLVGWHGNGTDLHMAIAAPDAPGALLIDHFSGYGMAQANVAQLEAQRERLPADPQARLTQEAAALIAEARRRESAGERAEPGLTGHLRALLQAKIDDVLVPLVETPALSCADRQDRIARVIATLRTARQLLGDADPVTLRLRALADALLHGPEAGQQMQACFDESYRGCVERQEIAGYMTRLARHERQSSAIGRPMAAGEHAGMLLHRCVGFRFEVQSTLSMLSPDGTFMRHDVVSSVPLRMSTAYDGRSVPRTSGIAAMPTTRFEFAPPANAGCTVTPGAIAQVTPVEAWLAVDIVDGRIGGLNFDWMPAGLRVASGWICDKVAFERDLPNWGTPFSILHTDECSAAGCFLVRDWTPGNGGQLLGRRLYERNATIAGVEYRESTLLTLRHDPRDP